ncbi:MAG: polysaccharide biosynthesis protein [Pyrinomonadaceae bacterium]|nr:polysaccharide biosynthesis protein [Pyrinomonadaceae bacterium]
MVIDTPRNRSNSSRSWRAKLLTRQAQFTLDTVVLVLAFMLAYLLRFDFVISERETQHMLYQLPFVLLLQLMLLWFAGIYAFVWRYVGMAEVKAFLTAALWSALPMIALRTWLPEQLQPARVPLSIIVMDTVIAFGGVLGLRVLRRAVYERGSKRQNGKGQSLGSLVRKPVLLIGAGRAGVMIAREIRLRGDVDMEVKGFIDDDPAKQGSVIQGVKVMGTAEDIPRLVSELNIDHVVISFAEASRRDFRRILDICERAKVRVRTVPGIYELLQGNLKVSRIRDVQIEDLLGREQVQLDQESMKNFLAGKIVMITGAGGSIGSELVRQVARFQPSCLLLVERAEFGLFAIEHEMRNQDSQVQVIALVADIGDKPRMHTIFQTYAPQVILHAAAHKHVPMMETNPSEAVKNNVLATSLLGEMASEFGVEAFVLISTDKAVRPSSVMGASKRVAELVIQDLDHRSETRFLAVRFGNVIGSAGSVIPIFQDQIRSGGPVTVTHPEMVRYFMTIPEASQLVLQAGALGRGGEIFILDMGEPVRILDLAKETIALSGLRPFEDINIVFTGVRPGEKLYEELQTTDEVVLKTWHPKIFIGRIAAYPEEKVRHALERLSILAQKGWDRELRKAINDLLPEAQLEIPSEEFAPIPQSFIERSHVAAGGD